MIITQAEVAEDSFSCEETKLCTSPTPVYSPSRSFLQITEKSKGSLYEASFIIANYSYNHYDII